MRLSVCAVMPHSIRCAARWRQCRASALLYARQERKLWVLIRNNGREQWVLRWAFQGRAKLRNRHSTATNMPSPKSAQGGMCGKRMVFTNALHAGTSVRCVNARITFVVERSSGVGRTVVTKFFALIEL